jgi:hypothetical protein
MIPAIIASQVKQGIIDFLQTTFETVTETFQGAFNSFLNEHGKVFKGPYISCKLPFLKVIIKIFLILYNFHLHLTNIRKKHLKD